ncbi:MAG TPA: DNA repair protein RadC [Bacteroidota bacterium]|nr:DNA repair protein RadC [Bacteroidota bacterium]
MRACPADEGLPGAARTAPRPRLQGERPREKLTLHGARTLSDAELLAVLLMTGHRGASAMEIACALLERGLGALARRNANELMRVPGVGRARALGIVASFELGRRLQADTGEERPRVRTPADAARLVIPRMRDLTQEVFAVLVLDAAGGVIALEELSRGTLNASIVHPREVFKAAVDHLGASVLVAHNHPSGNSEPSAEDLAITRQLADAGKILGIPLHDHLIVAGNAFVSLAERGHIY